MSPQAVDLNFWRGKRVFVTGHTGFKGAWLCLWLQSMSAKVFGYSLAPETPSLFEQANVAEGISHTIGDVRDLGALTRAVTDARPDIVFHLAAQSLVRPSYADPTGTFATNVMGTANLLEAVRQANQAFQKDGGAVTRAAVIVTTDKCYQNKEWHWSYREDDPLGGHDPYSASKACAELVAASYRTSFAQSQPHPAIATARAGNVIGGGDWAKDRLVPDAVRAFAKQETLLIRHPNSIRPWQHVLEPLAGYVLLAQRLCESGNVFAQAWNFGPGAGGERTVGEVASLLAEHWGTGASWRVEGGEHLHEAQFLKLDSSKARALLKWQPRLSLALGIEMTASWYLAHQRGASPRQVSQEQIAKFSAS
ncbi:MAG: CDP-glucose 4,6-dehydratase [Micropepsaceae bacterium]